MSSTIGTSGSLLSNLLSTGTLPTIGNQPTTDNSANLAVAGIASGLNWQTIVQELGQAEAAPEIQWEQQQNSINAQNSAFTTIVNDLTTLQTDIQGLQDSSLYEGSTAQSSNSEIATGTSTTSTPLGNYAFNISQLATSAQIYGSGNISQAISPDGNLSNVTVGSAGFSSAVTAGTFTVDGQQVTVSATESLQDLFNAISTATDGKVTASYSTTADKITLASSDNSEVVLGSAADTSNFLQVAQLYNNGTDSVTSTSALGHAQLGGTMSNADLATPITDGGSGQGAFAINGVTINYNASTESIQDVLNNINSSTAGVTASYDSINNRFVLTNNTTGDVGVSMQDVTGNFLAATGLSGGTLQHGKNLLYTLNGGTQQLVSQSNTITSASSSISGLSVTALQTGSVTMNVTSDTSSISSAIQQFVTDYNTVQNDISSQQLVTTSSSGSVTPGTLTADQTSSQLASSLRSLVAGSVSSLSGNAISMLSDLGIATNGKDNTLAVDTSTLNNALSGNMNNVSTLFNDSTNGIATQLNNFLNDTIGTNGTLTNHQASLTQQSNNISTQISNLNSQITTDEAQWTSEFEAMEQAESQSNQELTYLSEQVTNGSI
ncbi:MAG TPA: flagellar filament capping protein FliD [Verrucomicrobiae bacterium]|jgi:flagellar hook-associated protein 2|nr:flagellar filament capping protein FliD [Verrucomicrobiae bacterium]